MCFSLCLLFPSLSSVCTWFCYYSMEVTGLLLNVIVLLQVIWGSLPPVLWIAGFGSWMRYLCLQDDFSQPCSHWVFAVFFISCWVFTLLWVQKWVCSWMNTCSWSPLIGICVISAVVFFFFLFPHSFCVLDYIAPSGRMGLIMFSGVFVSEYSLPLTMQVAHFLGMWGKNMWVQFMAWDKIICFLK